MQWLIPKGSSLQKFPCNIYMWMDCLYLAGMVGILLNTTTFFRNVKQIENSNVIQKHFSGIFKIKSQWIIKKNVPMITCNLAPSICYSVWSKFWTLVQHSFIDRLSSLWHQLQKKTKDLRTNYWNLLTFNEIFNTTNNKISSTSCLFGEIKHKHHPKRCYFQELE